MPPRDTELQKKYIKTFVTYNLYKAWEDYAAISRNAGKVDIEILGAQYRVENITKGVVKNIKRALKINNPLNIKQYNVLLADIRHEVDTAASPPAEAAGIQ